jgi:hypothetical protein
MQFTKNPDTFENQDLSLTDNALGSGYLPPQIRKTTINYPETLTAKTTSPSGFVDLLSFSFCTGSFYL